MDANAQIDASVMAMPLIGDSLPTSKIDEDGEMLAEFVNIHNTHLADYVGIVGSWFQAAAGLRVIANLDNGLGKEDHRPVVVRMTCQHIAAPRVESGQVYLSYDKMKQEYCCERFRGLLEEAEPGPWQQD
eukprot:6612943-Pyramimonas_sp.AAC.1